MLEGRKRGRVAGVVTKEMEASQASRSDSAWKKEEERKKTSFNRSDGDKEREEEGEKSHDAVNQTFPYKRTQMSDSTFLAQASEGGGRKDSWGSHNS